jgi:hypothetical protein
MPGDCDAPLVEVELAGGSASARDRERKIDTGDMEWARYVTEGLVDVLQAPDGGI